MSGHQPRILIIENDSDGENDGEATRFFPFLERNGVEFAVVEAHKHLPLPPLEAYQAVIVTGGKMGVYEMDRPRYAFLKPECNYLLEAMAREMPVLGVCLGHQLLAHALGGEVVKAERPELGWLPVTLTEAGRNDSLFEGVEQAPVFLQFHFDEVIRLPGDAVRLARSEITSNESFRLDGKPVWGVQFHPEYPPEYAEALFRKYRRRMTRLGHDVDA